jgi:hypothetical protein
MSGDTITIQFSTGVGVDCIGTGRQCLNALPMAVGESPALTSHGVARAWFNGEGRFVMEVRQVLRTELWNELEGGSFYLEANVPLPASVMTGLGRQGQLHTLPSGVHPVWKQPDGSYRIVF